jgi:hypothetical protein
MDRSAQDLYLNQDKPTHIMGRDGSSGRARGDRADIRYSDHILMSPGRLNELLVYRKKGCRFTPVREKGNGAGICIEWPKPKQSDFPNYIFPFNEVSTFLTE